MTPLTLLKGILVSFGEPLTPNGYPTMKLDWYKTRRVVKMSKIVRQEQAAKYYGIENFSVKRIKAAPVAAIQAPEDVQGVEEEGTEVVRVNYAEKKSGSGLRYQSGTEMAQEIRNRRIEEKRLRADAKKKRRAEEDQMINQSLDQVVQRAEEMK